LSQPDSPVPSFLRGWGIPILLVAIVAAPTLVACNASGGPPSVSGENEEATRPARWIDQSDLFRPGFGRVTFVARDGNQLEAKIYRSSRFDPSSGPVWFVMHGASRDVDRYVTAAAPVAERYQALVIAPHFSREDYPKGTDYTLGVKRTGRDGLTLMGPNRWREPEDYIYAEIEHLFDATRASFGGHQRGYYVFGHSAGAQFTHRLLTFLPGARVLAAVAANAGWYTLPADEDPSYNTMPYGLRGAPLEPEDLRGYFAVPFVVLLGERDTRTAAESKMVRGTPEAMDQGETRLERGRNYFEVGQAEAKQLDTKFAWRLAVVPRAGHDAASMVDSAGFLLFVPDEPPCVASRANEAGPLVITQVLADPPRGAQGDANGDGERDPSADEFVEIFNSGSRPVCLSGWALGDAEKPERHVFPLGRALAPGGTVVVFGGGVPTGSFGGAEVQWSTKGLSLSNDGDVVTLRDRADEIALRFSWGDCSGEPCASDHWPAELGIKGSLVRRPAPGASWRKHVEIDGTLFSPGLGAERASSARRTGAS